jgi:hypothetical protein
MHQELRHQVKIHKISEKLNIYKKRYFLPQTFFFFFNKNKKKKKKNNNKNMLHRKKSNPSM